MNIVLTNLPSEGQYVNWTTPREIQSDAQNKYMPLGLISLATNIPSGHNLTILDAASEGLSIVETIERIQDLNPDVLGISALTRRAFALERILYADLASAVWVGGPHATHYSLQILRWGADAVFVGPIADQEFNAALEKLPTGVVYCSTPIRDIKPPDRSLVDFQKYFPVEHKLFDAGKRLPLFSSVGCPNRCIFCDVQTKRVQYKDPDAIVLEMQSMYDLGCDSVHILDDNFTIHPYHCQAIVTSLQKLKTTSEWSARGQVRMDLGLLEKMRSTGLKRLHVGIESLDDDILKFMRKPQTRIDIQIFCDECHRLGIDVLGYFILGVPGEKPGYLDQLGDQIRKLHIKYPFFNVLFPEPQTVYYDWLLDQGLYERDLWDLYMDNPTSCYRIPPPFGETKMSETLKHASRLIQEFS